MITMRHRTFSARASGVLLSLCLLLFVASAAEAQPKIGIIDLKKVFEGYWMTKQADTEIKESEADYLKSRKRLVEDYQRANEEYKRVIESANDQALSSEERARRKTDAERRVVEMREIEQSIGLYDRTTRQNLEDQSLRLRGRILEKIREVIDTQARAGNYTFVIDTAAETVNRTPVILYHNGENDLTDGVLKSLNAAAPILLPGQESPGTGSERKSDR
jgi:Skp family chaperone for outer membrane proteins